MSPIDFEVKKDKYNEFTVEEAEDVRDLVNDLNYLEAEGFIKIEEDADGEPRFYPV